MSNKKPRIRVTFEENINKLLTDLAKKEHRSIASVVRELIIEALENLFLSKFAESLDKKNVKLYAHDKAWDR
jgi:hypothetical protein